MLSKVGVRPFGLCRRRVGLQPLPSVRVGFRFGQTASAVPEGAQLQARLPFPFRLVARLAALRPSPGRRSRRECQQEHVEGRFQEQAVSGRNGFMNQRFQDKAPSHMRDSESVSTQHVDEAARVCWPRNQRVEMKYIGGRE